MKHALGSIATGVVYGVIFGVIQNGLGTQTALVFLAATVGVNWNARNDKSL